MNKEIVKVQKENILKPLAVGDLLQQEKGESVYKFFIPSYQRGYRWDEDQVTDLLDDFFEFITTSKLREDKYCLQPIVVNKLEDGRFEVLDGQQRLTTIFILLTRLKKVNNEIDLFQLEYETRPDSATFLKNHLNVEINTKNPDYFYISNAYKTIDDWLAKTKDIKANISSKIFDAIVESIEFIWYEIVDDTDAIDVFTRINIGKIPLTNAELVKAVFLSKNNLSLGAASEDVDNPNFDKILSFKQNAIALQWDQMEKTLQDKKVWGFIYGGNKTYETRIDYLLDLISHKTPTEKNKYFSFKHFYDKVKAVRLDKDLLITNFKTNTSFIEQEWSALKEVYDVLLEWYNNQEYNHLIGFLISQEYSVIDLIKDFKDNNRKDFKKEIKSKIKSSLNCDAVSELRYGKHNKIIERVLLLHNVVNSLLVKENNTQFPFDRMKGKLWTLEHIFAQNTDDLREEDYVSWLEDHLEFFKTKTQDKNTEAIIKNIENLLATKNNKIDKDDFEECFIKVSNYIQNIINTIDDELNVPLNVEDDIDSKMDNENEYDWINEDHSIANLALLDGSINSAIKNSLFDIKRKLILEKDKQGLFIPNETKKVFLKYYTPLPNHLAYWTFADRKAYVDSIKSTLKYLD